jgi:hypothetical protein
MGLLFSLEKIATILSFTFKCKSLAIFCEIAISLLKPTSVIFGETPEMRNFLNRSESKSLPTPLKMIPAKLSLFRKIPLTVAYFWIL